tara:strand:+ start:9663 stop:10118 length:456 start_codon:yes stop_codon:yes gene_type:complete
MNLSLTPLSEAYDLLKTKTKNKENIHTNTEYQKQILKVSNMETQNKLPTGLSTAPLQSTFNFQEIKNSKTDELTVKITDPELIALLRPYKEDYISMIIKEKMNQKKVQGVETFQNEQDNESFICDYDIKIMLGIVMMLIVLDIGLRMKIKF